MLTLRHWVLVIGGAGLFAGLPLSDALACDDDRFPCPIVSETPAQETASPARPPRKKVSQPARQKAHAKAERSAPRAAARTTASKPAVQEQAANSIPQKAAEAVPAMVASSLADQSANEESQNDSRLATAATAWPILRDTDGAGANSSEANSVDATEAAKANTVQLVGSNEVNELDQIAIARESSWNTYLMLVLGAALAAASSIWFLPRLISPDAGNTSGAASQRL